MATVSHDGWVRSCAGNGSCVEVKALGDDLFWLRRTGDIVPVPTAYTRAELDAFVEGWQAGEFDAPA
jgi:hypothetical protein